MHLALWIVASVLAFGFIAGGLIKLVTPKDRYAEIGHGSSRWADQFSPAAFKSIGAIEVTGGVGLVLPAAVSIAPILVPFAALGMGLYMAGATTTRLLRNEPAKMIAGDLLFVAMTVFVVWGRFDAEPFIG
ncbi:DoxX family protein [Nocardioidaceae bacterium SCSIO 66511]|nr:DoxX family protein [Nocardioidaceae bacterium SCSIO 66511]